MRRFGLAKWGVTFCCVLLGCASPNSQDKYWAFSDHAAGLAATSCPAGADIEPRGALSLTAEPLAGGSSEAWDSVLPKGIQFAGGWALSATDSRFGGLSGLAILETGQLLAISDKGAFIWIELENGAPIDRGHISQMRDDMGAVFPNKQLSDAEGLAYRDGLAIVSFERQPRILAYNLSGCGAAARGIVVSALPKRVGEREIPPNSGAEALVLSGYAGQLHFSYEQSQNGYAINGYVSADGEGRFLPEPTREKLAEGFSRVGSDELILSRGVRIAVKLDRAYDPATGNRNIIHMRIYGPGGEVKNRITLTLAPPLTLDNFEGVALARNGRDGLRVYVISDDNFSPRQRTLLFAFDIEPSLIPS